MPVIEFSAGVMANLPARMVSPTTTLTLLGNSTNSGADRPCLLPLLPYHYDSGATSANWRYQTFINIYKGVVPTDLSGLTLLSSRSSDILVSFPGTLASTFITTSVFSTNPVVINSTLVTASASGTASWFRWFVCTGSSSPPVTNAVIHQIVGTVGVAGSGSELEIGDTNIVAGRAYRITNLRLQFPSSFTY